MGADNVKSLTLFGFPTLGCSSLIPMTPTGEANHQVLRPGSASTLHKAALLRVQEALGEQYSILFPVSAHRTESSTVSARYCMRLWSPTFAEVLWRLS